MRFDVFISMLGTFYVNTFFFLHEIQLVGKRIDTQGFKTIVNENPSKFSLNVFSHYASYSRFHNTYLQCLHSTHTTMIRKAYRKLRRYFFAIHWLKAPTHKFIKANDVIPGILHCLVVCEAQISFSPKIYGSEWNKNDANYR